MSLEKDVAVTLARMDYSETSQILVLFTHENGKQRLIAKGIRRGTRTRFAAGVDLLEAGRVVFSRRDDREGRLGTLVEWQQTEAFLGLRANLKSLYAGQYGAEITAHLTEDGDPHPLLYDGIMDLLATLSSGGRAFEALVRFQQHLLTEIGLAPELSRCVVCGRTPGRTEPTYFGSSEGGVICRHCEAPFVEKRRVSPDVLRALCRREPLRSAAAVGAFDVLNYHLSHLMGREPRLAEHVVPAAERRRLAPPQS